MICMGCNKVVTVDEAEELISPDNFLIRNGRRPKLTLHRRCGWSSHPGGLGRRPRRVSELDADEQADLMFREESKARAMTQKSK